MGTHTGVQLLRVGSPKLRSLPGTLGRLQRLQTEKRKKEGAGGGAQGWLPQELRELRKGISIPDEREKESIGSQNGN